MSTRTFVALSILIAILAWVGLALMFNYLEPLRSYQALAIPLVIIAVGGTTAPLWRTLQRRITPDRDDSKLNRMAVRQGLWAGLFVAILLTLRVFRVLDWVLVLVAAALFIMLEVFIQQREQWKQVQSRMPRNSRSSGSSRSQSSPTPPTQSGASAASFSRTASTKTTKSRKKTSGQSAKPNKPGPKSSR
ncbi:MAG: hypothetical protein J5I90_09700 [Caldilineales bacterium]|nr:hypothetical protein [Caldilineales bacterium]